MLGTKSQIQETQRTQSRINVQKQTTPRHIIFKLKNIKDKKKIWKESRGKKYLTEGQYISDFSETMQARRK